MAKKKSSNNDKYERWKRELTGIHQFSFKNRKNFTPQQKAAITRIYKGTKKKQGLSSVVRAIKNGEAVFKPAKRSQRERLKGRFSATNKGIVIYGEGIKGVSIKGQGKGMSVLIKRTRVIDRYFPKRDGESINDAVKRVFSDHAPDQVKLAVGQYVGIIPYNPHAFSFYDKELQTLEEEIMDDYGLDYDETPFNGVYGIYYTD